jgi:ribosomal protein L15E
MRKVTDGTGESVLVNIDKKWVKGTVEEVTHYLASMKTYTNYWVRLDNEYKKFKSTMVKVDNIDKIVFLD